MKNVKKLMGLLLLLITGISFGQSVDATRMQRDIEIAEQALATLARQGNDTRFWGNSIEGSYIEGYGVIFSLPRNFMMVSGARGVAWSTGDAVEVPLPSRGVAVDQDRLDSIQNVRKEKLTEVMKMFLVEYADLIGQLKPQDKIMVVQKKSDFNYAIISEVTTSGVYSIDDARREMGISAEIKKSDINDYKQGKISYEQAMAKVEMNYDLESKTKREPDLELFSSILGRAFRQDLTETYWTSSSPSYERLQGFGVIYNMRVFSRVPSGDFFNMPTLGEERISREEGLKKVAAAYPKFEEDIVRATVEYGRTIRSLEEDENLMIKVKLTECRGCDMPESIDVTVKKSVLSQFNSGKLSLEDATRQVKVTKYPYK